MTPYTPRAGSIAGRVMDQLRGRDWVANAVLADDADADLADIAQAMRYALEAGAVERRKIDGKIQWRLVQTEEAEPTLVMQFNPRVGMARYALWSNGSLEIRRSARDAMLLSLEESKQLLEYLDGLRRSWNGWEAAA